MELREIVEIFKRERKVFLGVVAAFLCVGVGVFFFQPQIYSVNLMLNVTRSGIQKTQDYRYDDFYRLQADERFADTVVRWIASPQIEKKIYQESGINRQRPIKARRLSSQMIETSFVLDDGDDAEKIATATLKILNGQTETLNKDQASDTWFVLIANDPFVTEKKIGPAVAFAASLMLGLFFGAWGVMINHYFKRK